MNLTLKMLSNEYWVAQVDNLEPSVIEQIQKQSTEFWTLSKTTDETSIVSNMPAHPSFVSVEGPWSAFRIVGQLDFSLTGIMSKCTTLLADQKISIFAISTFDTDYFLVRKENTQGAISAWRAGEITVQEI